MKNEMMIVYGRKEIGKNSLKQLRRDNFVPGVVYGHNKETLNIKIEESEISRFLSYHGIGSSLMLNLKDEEKFVLIKDIQKDVMKGGIVHVDFLELTLGEKVKTQIPIYFVNKESVEDARSVVQETLHELEIETLPKDLVEHVEFDAAILKKNSTVKISDLEIFKNPNITILNDSDLVVASLVAAGAKVKPEAEEAEEISIVEELTTL